jgi:hypothetical protein
MPPARRVIALPALALAILGCGGGPAVQQATAVDAAAPLPSPDGFVFSVPDAAAGQPPAGDGGSCAFQSFTGKRAPVDLLVLADASSSMADKVTGGTRSKWLSSHDALVAFARDPGSAGLGLGLQFFPLAGNGTACASSSDCGLGLACEQRRVCLTPGMPPGDAPGCGPLGPFTLCPSTSTCSPIGSCSMTGLDCGNIGAACPGGLAGDTCQPQPLTCQSAADVCTPASYQNLAAPIADLPGAALAFVRTLSMRRPGGATPMSEGVIGSLNHLHARLTAMPGRRAALIVATDGVPSGCSNQDIPAIADAIYTAAHSFSPPIPTYVIGVLDDMTLDLGKSGLGELARAGGTGTPFIISPTDDLSAKLLAALGQIRGDVLPCDYAIPEEKKGSLDFGQVNVHFAGAMGDEDLGYVARQDRCDARGGWYYDVDPALGGTPSRVVTCPGTCSRLKAEAGGKVELRFGCKTLVIQ